MAGRFIAMLVAMETLSTRTPAPLLFAPAGQQSLADEVAAGLATTASPLEERDFEDGEHKLRLTADAGGGDCYILQSLHAHGGFGVNDRLVRTLFLAGALRDHGAARVTAVLPYLAYARKDRRTKPGDALSSRYIAQLIEAMGVERVLALDVHNPAAFENAFRIPARNLQAGPALLEAWLGDTTGGPFVVLSPDAGGYKRAERLREQLATRLGEQPGIGFMEKKRSGGVVSGDTLVGRVDGCTVCIVDDLVSSGGTLARAAEACMRAGAREVVALVTHGLFTGNAAQTLNDSPITRMYLTDSVRGQARGALPASERLSWVSAAPLLAQGIAAAAAC